MHRVLVNACMQTPPCTLDQPVHVARHLRQLGIEDNIGVGVPGALACCTPTSLKPKPTPRFPSRQSESLQKPHTPQQLTIFSWLSTRLAAAASLVTTLSAPTRSPYLQQRDCTDQLKQGRAHLLGLPLRQQQSTSNVRSTGTHRKSINSQAHVLGVALRQQQLETRVRKQANGRSIAVQIA